ncbi:apical ring associated protein 1, putative [Plasmodium malariae]|uniref:Apical ring associated protein 1, putative n=1 Tax=Plasmodium malariae TaxID=5858 RepID=A0A1C3L271_PLAMA|nr:apical ring associated protein 1, putative [Plasmodium malariae]
MCVCTRSFNVKNLYNPNNTCINNCFHTSSDLSFNFGLFKSSCKYYYYYMKKYKILEAITYI